jgi:hypothetical protein
MYDKIENLINFLKNNMDSLKIKNAMVGFDGFIDSIFYVVKNKKNKERINLFQCIEEFGSYIISRKGKSCTFELNRQVEKIGGNMPILAAALGKLGIQVDCIGALGFPEIKDVFRSMADTNCNLFSVSEPGYTSALEFNDGKILFAQMNDIDNITWNSIKDIIGFKKIVRFFLNSNLIGIVNWSEVEDSNSIWEGIINDIFPIHIPNKKQIMYFDLADCSKRYEEDILHALDLINSFANHYKVILGMNENEAIFVFEALYNNKSCCNLESMGDRIFERLHIDILVIHPREYSIAWYKNSRYRIDNQYIEFPKLSTGGGDNFNAGFAAAQLIDLDIESSLILANSIAGYYIKYGLSPDQEQLISYLHKWKDSIVNKTIIL